MGIFGFGYGFDVLGMERWKEEKVWIRWKVEMEV